MPLSAPQHAIATHPARFKVAVCGRRFGKTYLARNRMAKAATQVGARVGYMAPTLGLARSIMWEFLKDGLEKHRWLRGRPKETTMECNLVNGARITLYGGDHYDVIIGKPFDYFVFDEFALQDPRAWTKAGRPTLADRRGGALFIGTPEGRNHFHRLYTKALTGDDPEWAAWQFTTIQGGQIPASEIEAARRDLDALTFAQEFEASFITFDGQAYYAFHPTKHVKPCPYQPHAPLVLCLDFNVAPGVASIVQEFDDHTGVIDEIHIPRGSNTPRVMERFLARYRDHAGEVRLYGDATGGNSGTAKVSGSDWDIVTASLRPVFGSRLSNCVGRTNPPERTRVNAVNSRLESAAGGVRLFVDPRCAETIRDFEGVTTKSNGEIDKAKTPELTHLTDALGYYIADRYPLLKGIVSNHGI